MRDQLSGWGIPPSTYVDSGGLNPRADIAELHLAQSHQSRELGNMKNPSDSARMKTLGRPKKYADAVVAVSRAASELRPARSSNPRSSTSGRLPALDLLLEVL